MADVHSPEVRSYNMSRIRSADTKPELLLRKLLFANGFRYRLHDRTLPGKPDIVLKKYSTVIFMHGCFWHGHEGCKYFKIPATRTEWWSNKIARNVSSDELSRQKLAALGWKVIVVWQCELRKDRLAATLERVLQQLKAAR